MLMCIAGIDTLSPGSPGSCVKFYICWRYTDSDGNPARARLQVGTVVVDRTVMAWTIWERLEPILPPWLVSNMEIAVCYRDFVEAVSPPVVAPRSRRARLRPRRRSRSHGVPGTEMSF